MALDERLGVAWRTRRVGAVALTKWSDCVQVCSQLGPSAEWCRVEAKYAPGDAYLARRPTRIYLLVCFGEVVSRTQKARRDVATSRREGTQDSLECE